MNYDIEWETDQPELTDELRAKIATELAYLTEQLDQPGDLIFHHIWTTDDMDGPVILVYGKEESPDTFYMSYYEDPEWVTLDNIEDNNED